MRRGLHRAGLGGLGILLLASAPVLLSERSILGETLANLRLPLGLGGGVVVLCLALGERRRRLTPMAIAGGLAVIHLLPTAALSFGRPMSAPAPSGPELRVAVANLRFGMADPAALKRLSDAFRPDVLGLVEVLTPNRGGTDWRAELESWRDRWPHQEVLPYGSRFELALLSRYPVLDAHRGEVDDAVGGLLSMPPILEATLAVEGRPVRFVLAHVYPPGTRSLRRAREVLLKRIVATDFRGPRVVMGDLNMTGTSPLFRDLLELGGLRDTRPGFGACLSWSLLALPGKILCLDHVLVGGELAVEMRGVSRDIRSDHLAAITVLRLAERSSETAVAQ